MVSHASPCEGGTDVAYRCNILDMVSHASPCEGGTDVAYRCNILWNISLRVSRFRMLVHAKEAQMLHTDATSYGTFH